jgi:1-acyl-sn-glycerol-3-phosphate acyltransferase
MSEERKKNPLTTFLKKFVLEPADDLLFASQRVLESFGFFEPVRSSIYVGESIAYNALFKQLYNYQIHGADHIRPFSDGKCIYSCTHQSLMDPLGVGLAIHQTTQRQPYQLAKIELFGTPLMNNYVRVNRAIPVRRGDSDQAALDKTVDLVNEGHQVVVFPEGTLRPGGNQFLTPHTGVAQIAYLTQAPVVPCTIYGIDEIFGKSAKFPKAKGTMKVAFGKAFTFEEMFPDPPDIGLPDYSVMKKITKRIFRRMTDLWNDMFELHRKEKAEREQARAETET